MLLCVDSEACPPDPLLTGLAVPFCVVEVRRLPALVAAGLTPFAVARTPGERPGFTEEGPDTAPDALAE